MLYPLRYLSAVGQDLEDILTFLESDPEYADRVVRDILLAADLLSSFPYCGPPLADSRLTGYRQLIVLDGDYRVIYKVREEDVLVFAVFSTVRDLFSAWHARRRSPSDLP